MIYLQQYLIGLAFFGILSFLYGLIREFRELKKVTRTDGLTGAELRQMTRVGLSAFVKMFLCWNCMYAFVIGVAWIGN
jgi:hypothetical protein